MAPSSSGFFSKFLVLVILFGILTIVTTYTLGILSTESGTQNVTNTSWETQYNSNTQVQKATFSIVSALPLVFVILMLLMALLYLLKQNKKRW